MGDIEEVEAEVRKFLNGGKNNKALKFLLEDPPVTSKDKDLKVRFLVLKSRRFRARIYLSSLIIDTLLTSRSTQQNKYAELVFNVMKNIRSEKISVSVGKLDTDQLDVLMK